MGFWNKQDLSQLELEGQGRIQSGENVKGEAVLH